MLRDGDEDVKNALYVSYLEHLEFQDGKRARAWAKAAMPPALHEAWQSVTDYNEALARGSMSPKKGA